MTPYQTHLNYLNYLVFLASSRFTRAYAQSRALELEGRSTRWAGMAQALKQAIEAMDAEKHQGGSEVKQHIDRLKEMLTRMEAHEKHAQGICGDCQPDSIRASEAEDAKALRAVLAVVSAREVTA